MTESYRSQHDSVRNPRPVVEISVIDQQIAALNEKRQALADLQSAAQRLLGMGYTRRQVRAMAGDLFGSDE